MSIVLEWTTVLAPIAVVSVCEEEKGVWEFARLSVLLVRLADHTLPHKHARAPDITRLSWSSRG